MKEKSKTLRAFYSRRVLLYYIFIQSIGLAFISGRMDSL